MLQKAKTYALKKWRQATHRINKEKLKLGPKQFTFAFFFVLSTIFWFLNALSREYVDTVEFPVHYKSYPKELVLLNEPPSHLQLQVNAYGYSLFYHLVTPELIPLEIDFNKTPLRNLEQGDTTSYFIETNYLQEQISRQLNSEIKLMNIKPDSLIFSFTHTIRKKVPVVLDKKITLDKPFRIKGKIILSPDSVTITGPSSLVRHIEQVSTQTFEREHNKENITEKIELKPLNHIAFSNSKINIFAELERYTEGELFVNIKIKGLPDSLQLTLFPSRVKINFIAGLDLYKHVNPKNFKAYVNFDDVMNTISNKIPVHISPLVQDVEILQYSPRYVEFYIEKRQ